MKVIDRPPSPPSEETLKRKAEERLEKEEKERELLSKRAKLDLYGTPANSPIFQVKNPRDNEDPMTFLSRQLLEAKTVRDLCAKRIELIQERIRSYKAKKVVDNRFEIVS